MNKYMHTHVHNSTIHNSQMGKPLTWPSTVEQIHNCTSHKNGVLFSHKKEWSIEICYNVDEPQKHPAQ